MKIEDLEVPGYERVARAEDEESGLEAIIAVHDTTLGPAVGGIRMWPYATGEEALTDVLRLAEGMTLKSAVAETGLGGGKAVIIGDSRTQKTELLLRAMGRFVNAFEGTYYPAEDIGTEPRDLEIVAEETRWVTGLSRSRGGSGNPSPFTALGTYLGIRACVEETYGTSGVKGKAFAIQGLGSVGLALARHLAEGGAKLIVADVRKDRLDAAVDATGARAVAPEEILEVEVDVLSPCALGAVLNDLTIPNLRCRIVAGAANNQLLEARHADALRRRGILYAPDFVINAGGIINVSAEFAPGGYNEDVALRKIQHIDHAVRSIVLLARERDLSTHEAALLIARQKIEQARRSKAKS